MSRNFDEWLAKFRLSISGYDYYIDFNKVINNVEKLKIELSILNSLIGSKDIEMDFENIINKYPETIKCKKPILRMDLLLFGLLMEQLGEVQGAI